MNVRTPSNHSNQSNRWVGFDMDECLGSFMPLWPFVELLPEEARMSNTTQKSDYLRAVAKRVSETTNMLRLFRPGIPELVRKLKDAQRAGNIAGCFILTNNGSQELAEVVRFALNLLANPGPNNNGTAPPLFPVAWYRYSPCRQRSENPRKDWATIQACLRHSGLPTMSRAQDLLYYDDQDHVLASEIPHYVRVAEYTAETPSNLVFHALRPVFQQHGVPATAQEAVLRDALREEGNNRNNRNSRNSQNNRNRETAFPTAELDAFVGSVGIAGGKRQQAKAKTRARARATATRGCRTETRRRKRAIAVPKKLTRAVASAVPTVPVRSKAFLSSILS